MSDIRRIVTGHDKVGRAVFVADGKARPQLTRGVETTNLWLHRGAPDNTSEYADPVIAAVPLEPPDRGTVLRIVNFPPAETESAPDIHRTASLDYAYIIEGEIYAVMDDDSTLMHAGDVLIQRGTNHGWVNRSDRACRVLFALLDAEPIS
ncbi:cupin domain-containing protein [Nocardia rhizosphaerae]|uniref:Cupin domain-containing protein n=1 Tax=Nocardia rhizosphaerae TaxID=1691571 RepID=A0ABV8LAD6_9NOCA